MAPRTLLFTIALPSCALTCTGMLHRHCCSSTRHKHLHADAKTEEELVPIVVETAAGPTSPSANVGSPTAYAAPPSAGFISGTFLRSASPSSAWVHQGVGTLCLCIVLDALMQLPTGRKIIPPPPLTVHLLACCISPCRMLTFDAEALAACRVGLRSAVEMGTILLWFYVADRTPAVGAGPKEYIRDVFLFIFLVLTLVAGSYTMKKGRAPVLINRQQTEEWKGWMQASQPCAHPADCDA